MERDPNPQLHWCRLPLSHIRHKHILCYYYTTFYSICIVSPPIAKTFADQPENFFVFGLDTNFKTLERCISAPRAPQPIRKKIERQIICTLSKGKGLEWKAHLDPGPSFVSSCSSVVEFVPIFSELNLSKCSAYRISQFMWLPAPLLYRTSARFFFLPSKPSAVLHAILRHK